MLETEEPLSIKDIEEKTGYTNASAALDTLRHIGVVHSFRKEGERNKTYHIAYPRAEPKSVSSEFTPHVKQASNHFGQSVAPAPEIVTAPEHDPNPSLVDIPYIPLPPHASANLLMRMKGLKETTPTNMSAAEFLKHRFEEGDREGFQQAHDKDGNPGRWVFVGYKQEGKQKEVAPHCEAVKSHPATSDLIL